MHWWTLATLAGLVLPSSGCGQADGAPAQTRAAPAAAASVGDLPARPTPTVLTHTIGQPAAVGTLAEVVVLSAIDAAVPDASAKRATRQQTVRVFVALGFRVDGTLHWYADATRIRIGRRLVQARPLAEAPTTSVRWLRVEPAVASLSNTETGSFRYARIAYAETPWSVDAPGVVAVDVRPTLTPDYGNGLGTMRFAVVATQGATQGANQGSLTVRSPGADAERQGAAGGLTDAVHRISIRNDDSALGYMTEMFGQPYIWASAGPNPRAHQSEHLEGADCADLMVYGARAAGASTLPYTWTGELPKHTRLLAAGAVGTDGIYRDRKGLPLPFTQPGDLLLFPRHVGALVEDRGEVGVLDHADTMLHHYFDTPRVQPLADTAYAHAPIELRRWR